MSHRYEVKEPYSNPDVSRLLNLDFRECLDFWILGKLYAHTSLPTLCFSVFFQGRAQHCCQFPEGSATPKWLSMFPFWGQNYVHCPTLELREWPAQQNNSDALICTDSDVNQALACVIRKGFEDSFELPPVCPSILPSIAQIFIACPLQTRLCLLCKMGIILEATGVL